MLRNNLGRACRLVWPAILLLLLAACRPEPDVVVITVPPTRSLSTLAAPHTGEQPPATTVVPVAPLPAPTVTTVALTTTPASAPPTATPPAPEAPPSDTLPDATYRIIYVTGDDRLNVRSGPGVNNQVQGSLAPDARGIRVTGAGEVVRGNLWLPIESGSVTGWVNSLFLTEEVPPTDFCNAAQPNELVAEFRMAIAGGDAAGIAELVHPERGLRVRHSWWNPEVWLSRAEVAEALNSGAVRDWGVADGSGLPLRGSFREVILPLLQADLAGASETACNELLHGGTAGIVQLPDEYASANFYSVYRPAPDDEFDWGSWAIGIERWDGRYYLTYLVHYAWEI